MLFIKKCITLNCNEQLFTGCADNFLNSKEVIHYGRIRAHMADQNGEKFVACGIGGLIDQDGEGLVLEQVFIGKMEVSLI
jgi:hypothetical protein